MLLFAPKAFVKRAVAHDVAKEFETNTQLQKTFPNRELPPERLAEHEKLATKRVRKIRSALLSAFIYTLSAIAAAVFSAMILSSWMGKPSTLAVYAIQIVAAGIILIATLAVLGWEIQSWKGNTLPEKVNRWLFRSQYWVGTYLFVLAVSWDESAI